MSDFEAKQIASMDVSAATQTATIHFTDQNGEKHTLSVGIKALKTLGDEALRGLIAYLSKQAGGESQTRGDWAKIPISDPLEVDVVDLPLEPAPCLALVFDKNTERQIGFRLSPDAADSVAERMKTVAEQCRGQIPNQ